MADPWAELGEDFNEANAALDEAIDRIEDRYVPRPLYDAVVAERDASWQCAIDVGLERDEWKARAERAEAGLRIAVRAANRTVLDALAAHDLGHHDAVAHILEHRHPVPGAADMEGDEQ